MAEQKRLLTGNQAVARGFYEAGGMLAASYPGSPVRKPGITLNLLPANGRYTMLPPYTIEAKYFMRDRMQKLAEYADDCP